MECDLFNICEQGITQYGNWTSVHNSTVISRLSVDISSTVIGGHPAQELSSSELMTPRRFSKLRIGLPTGDDGDDGDGGLSSAAGRRMYLLFALRRPRPVHSHVIITLHHTSKFTFQLLQLTLNIGCSV